MAKEYQVLFRLGAALGTNFNGTFSAAQKTLAAAQKEIDSLNRVQSDISAYQRQQVNIERTNSKLEMYKKQLENVQAEMAQSGSQSSELANRELELQQRILSTEEALAEKNQRLSQMSGALTEAGVDVHSLSEESQRLAAQTAQLSDEQRQAAEEARNFGNSSTSAFEAVGGAIITSGIVKGPNEIYDAYKECVSISMEFGSTMSTVEALSGANSEEMQQLSDMAKELGATTKYTATQSAEAMTYMGMAGWDAQEMMSGMSGMLNLAAASGEDLGLTSDIVTDNLTAFGLSAADTAHFADVLAQAASNSNTSVAIMGETFSGSAAIAGALGYSIEDAATAVGLMANAGVKGSVAGTSLKNIFNGLTEGANLSATSIGKVEFSAVNADGTMKSFGETIDELRGYFEQMTDVEQVNNAKLIAGQRGYNGLLTIINATDEEFSSLRNNINNCTGAAERMAKIRMDNLQGDVTLLDSAADGLKETIGELYNDDLRKLAQMGAAILTSVNEFCQQNPVLVKSLMAISAEIGVVVLAYNAWNVAKKAKNALDELGNALKARKAAAAAEAAAEAGEATATTGAAAAQQGWNLAMLASPIFIFTAAVAALTVGVIALNKACEVEDFQTTTLTESSQRQKEELDSLTAKYDEACEKYGENSEQAQALKYDVDQATESFEYNKRTVSDLYAELDTLHSSYEGILGTWTDTNREIRSQGENTQSLIAKMRDLTSASDGAVNIDKELLRIVGKLNEAYPDLGLSVEDVNNNLDGMIDRINAASIAESKRAKYNLALETKDQLEEQQAQLEAALAEAEEAMNKAGKDFAVNSSDQWYSALFTKVGWQNIVARATSFGAETEGQIQKAYSEAQQKYWQAAEDARNGAAALADAQAVIDEYEGMVSGTAETTATAFEAMNQAIYEVRSQSELLLESYNEAYEAAYDSVTGQYSLWDIASTVIPTSIQTINDALTTQASYWSDYNTDLTDLLKRADDIDGLREMLASFSDGSEESVNAVAGMVRASDEELTEAVNSWKELMEQQKLASQELADVKVDFESELGNIASAMEDTVNRMNLDEEARAAAEATISAYVEEIKSYRGSAGEAADEVAEAVRLSLYGADLFNNTTSVTNGGTKNAVSDITEQEVSTDPISYYVGNGTYKTLKSNPNSAKLDSKIKELRQYATGTYSADYGYALVGEEGPELVKMSGGERVYNTSETRAIAAELSEGGQTIINITASPSFTVSGNTDDIESTMQQYSNELVDRVMDALESAGIDRKRCVYA
ncbi:MAG: phage tail tape measure protein [Oscillospiraceae bacterium]